MNQHAAQVDFVDTLVDRVAGTAYPVLRLFGGPWLRYGGGRVEIPESGKRLLVFVALHRSQVQRRYCAASLWPDGSDARAAGNLRSAVWRLNQAGIDLVVSAKHTLMLRDDVVVDARVVGDWAARLIRGPSTAEDLVTVRGGLDAIDILPGWYDDWAIAERERLRQRLLHALEALSRRLLALGRVAEAVEAATAAVLAEPLRESAQYALLQAHLAEGNWGEGRRSYLAYRTLLRRELGVEPGPRLATLLRSA
jgi:DNA-binding SARP family transcriptional activator